MAVLSELKALDKSQRAAFVASLLGWTLDAFDFFLLTFVVGQVAKDFHVKPPAVLLSLTLTLAARPFGALFFGWLADKFGRKPILQIDVALYAFFAVGSAFAPNLITLTPAEAGRLFGLPPGLSSADVRKTLAQDVLAAWQGRGPPPEPRLAGFESLGLMDPAGQVVVPVLAVADEQALSAIAADFRPALLAVLEGHRAALTAAWRASPYADEGVSFEEYAIWWYHLFYTAVTDRLIRGGQIAAPPGGVLTYFTLS